MSWLALPSGQFKLHKNHQIDNYDGGFGCFFDKVTHSNLPFDLGKSSQPGSFATIVQPALFAKYGTRVGNSSHGFLVGRRTDPRRFVVISWPNPLLIGTGSFRSAWLEFHHRSALRDGPRPWQGHAELRSRVVGVD